MEQNCAESKVRRQTLKECVLCIFSRVLVYLINNRQNKQKIDVARSVQK